MGMDVYGKNPATEKGSYFRRNVWGWRPLWQYVEDTHPEIASLVKYAQSNDGDGLNKAKSLQLAKLLNEDVISGKAKEYVQQRNEYLANLPLLDCELCEATGIRSDKVGVDNGMPTKELSAEQAIVLGRTHGTCNACNATGKKEDWATSYYLDESDVAEFAEFLEHCGGFEIW